MSHYSNLVIIEQTSDVEAAVKAAMGPHEEQGGFWDWYQIGGRWTGALDGYDPELDPRNIEVCDLCLGTGVRKDMTVHNGCNGCDGKGKRAKWPTQFAKHEGDIMPIESLTEAAYSDKFFRVITPRGRVFGGENYMPWKADVQEMFQCLENPPLAWLKEEYKGHLVVVVDNHS